MNKTLMTQMKDSISEIFETMFFMPVEFTQESRLSDTGLGKGDDMACRLDFSGDQSGTLMLVAPNRLLVNMCENFLGEPEENLKEEHLSGTLTEVANMACGNALSHMKCSVPYELSIPERIEDLNSLGELSFTLAETPEGNMGFCLKIND